MVYCVRTSKSMFTRRLLVFLFGFILVYSVLGEETEHKCKSKKGFQCRSQPEVCIPLERVRDGKPDCLDASDEECQPDEFQCRSNLECVPKERLRDGWNDCLDGSDEECPPEQFRCDCGLPRCVQSQRVRDGVPDCIDGSDEGKSNKTKCLEDDQLQDLMALERRKRQAGGVLTETERSPNFQPEATPVENVATPSYTIPAGGGKFEANGRRVVKRPRKGNGGPRRAVVRRLRPGGDGSAVRSRPVVIRRSRPVGSYIPSPSPVDELSSLRFLATSSVFGQRISAANQNRLTTLDIENFPAASTAKEATPQPDKPLKRIIRLRRPPGAASSNQRKKILVSRRPVNDITLSSAQYLQGRGPISAEDSDLTNVLDNNGNVLLKHATILQSQALPITYYTTYTYYTTFLHGPNTVYTSREAVVSSVATQTPNPETVKVIQSFGGYTVSPNGDNVIPLGSRTFGETTTVVNLASRIQIFNNDIYSGVYRPAPAEVTPYLRETTSAVGNLPRLVQNGIPGGKALETVDINQLATLPKTVYTLFTYYYTFYDGLSTRQSVRAETVSNVVSDAEPLLSQSHADFINSQGLLTIGPETKVINLGSRGVSGTTTEVNLGLRTIVHFSGISNVVIQKSDIQPTRSYSLSESTQYYGDNQLEQTQAVKHLFGTSDLLQPSYSSASDIYDNRAEPSILQATPEISVDTQLIEQQNTQVFRKPYRVITTVVQRPGGPLPSGAVGRRPGVRVRIRPGSSRRLTLESSAFISQDSIDLSSRQSNFIAPSGLENVDAIQPTSSIHITNIHSSSNLELLDNVRLSEVDNNPIPPDLESVEATPALGRNGRRRLKITVRRPFQAENATRAINSRFVRPSRFEITTKPRLYVVTRTGAVGDVRPSKRPVSVKIGRRPKPTDAPVEGVRIKYETYTTLSSVPVIFGLETSYRNVIVTTSSPVTVTDYSTDFDGRSEDIQPTQAIVFTYFTTTTFTVPYTVGDQTLLTTVEETNSRIVTQTYALPDRSTEDSKPLPATTSIEFGFGGPTTHIVFAGNDGSTTSSVLYPSPYGSPGGTKVVRIDHNGVGVTSFYGSVPIGAAQPTSSFVSRHTLPPIQVVGPHQTFASVSSRPGYVTRISDGVMLIVASGGADDSTQLFPQSSTALTLQPSLVTDAVLMKTKGDEALSTIIYNTRTFFTTYTFFTTFFTDGSSSIASSEQVVSNVVTVPITQRIVPTTSPHHIPITPSGTEPVTIFESSERLITSTAYSTFTIYATLFNGSSSFVTPLEEVHSQVFTITEPFTVTRVITPTPTPTFNIATVTQTLEPSTFEVTKTLYTTYTNFVTFFQGTDTIVSSLEEVVSSIMTMTLFGNSPTTTSTTETSSKSSLSTVNFDDFTTRTYLTTQTHYITLFSGTQTILSSIEEVGTQVRTERIEPTSVYNDRLVSTTSVASNVAIANDSVSDTEDSFKASETGVVQLQTSIRTLYTTYTFFTTYFSDSRTLISSSEEIATSYVTLYIPRTVLPSDRIAETPSPSTSLLTTTEFSTFTLFTTLFNEGDKVIVSSETVVPEVITATVTMTPILSPSPSPTMETVLTLYTTYTFYDTVVSGSETIVLPSESVVTHLVTATRPVGSDSTITSLFSEKTSDPEIVDVATVVSSEVVIGTDVETKVETQIHSTFELPSTVSLDETTSIVIIDAHSNTDIDTNSPSVLSGTSTTVIDGSTVIFFTDFHDNVESESSETAFSPSLSTVAIEISPSHTDITKSTDLTEAITSTIVLKDKTIFVGNNGDTTSLSAKDTLFLITGIDGSITRLTEAIPTPFDIQPSTSSNIIKPSANVIRPGSVIELSDLLGGNANLGGNIGEAIKGIVNLITAAGKKKNDTSDESTDNISGKNQPPLPPREGVAVNREEEPVYIPIGVIGSSDTLQPVFRPVDKPSHRIEEGTDFIQPSVTYTGAGESFSPGTLVKGFTPFDEETTKTSSSTVLPSIITGKETVFFLPKGSSGVPSDIPNLQGSVQSRKEDKVTIKPTPSVSTSVITGAKTIFLGGPISKESQLPANSRNVSVVGVETIFFDDKGSQISKTETKITGATTVFGSIFSASESSSKSVDTLLTQDGQTVVSKTSTGATTIFYPDGFNIQPSISDPVQDVSGTKYVTRVETLTRTLTLTTTKIYYTRDSPITITSVFTTTIPPRTFVSTIVGTRTILGTITEATESIQPQTTIVPSESTTTVTTTTRIFNSITTTVVRTLVIPTKATKTISASESPDGGDSKIFESGTESPASPPESADSTSVTQAGSPKFVFNRPSTGRTPSGRRPVIAFRAPTRSPEATTPKTKSTGPKPRIPFPTRPPTTHTPETTTSAPTQKPKFGRNDEPVPCTLLCEAENKEVCKLVSGKPSCECRPGFARKADSRNCEEIQTYVVLLRVVKMGEDSLSYKTEFSDSNSIEFNTLAEMAKKGLDGAYKATDVKENYIGSGVNSILDIKDLEGSESGPEGIFVNFTVQVNKNAPVSEAMLKEELSRSLKESNYSIGGTELFVSPNLQSVRDIQDFDECSEFDYNDCARHAVCKNLRGTYICECKEHFQDLDPLLPGRICIGETKNCDYCNGRGDCVVSEDSKRSCRCQRMYIGRRCEINGLVLAIVLPIAAALVILLFCCVFCCCRRMRRHRAQKGKGGGVFKGMSLINPISGTLDKKAMIDTSSESSDHTRPHLPQAFDGFAESDLTPKKSSRRSDMSLDRSLSTGFTMPPVVIPRARHHHPKQVNYPGYMW